MAFRSQCDTDSNGNVAKQALAFFIIQAITLKLLVKLTKTGKVNITSFQ